MSQDESQISRVTRSKQQTKRNYDKISRWYDIVAGPSRLARLSGWACIETGLQKMGAKKGETVLEIGFGSGHCILALARSVGHSVKVYGLDISEGMCNIARARVKEAGLSERVELKCGDAAVLPFEASFFDAVFMSFTLELFDTPEIPTVLHECRRALRSGGRICVVAYSKRNATMITRLFEWFHRKFPKYVDYRPIFARKALEEAGFQTADVTEMSLWGARVEIVVGKKV